MGKNRIKLILEPDNEYHVHCDSGDGYQHEYTIKVSGSDSGTFYSMAYSDSNTWSEETKGDTIFTILNDGNGYKWMHTTLMSFYIDYLVFHQYSIFFRVIQQLESDPKFSIKVLKINELTNFNF